MAQSELEVSNLALIRIGEKTITALNEGSKAANACTTAVDICKRNLLRKHPWNFAVKRVTLTPTYFAISNVADNGSGLMRVTSATHGLATGDRVTIENVSGVAANGQWIVTVINATTIDLDDSTFSGTYVASSTDQLTKAPAFDFSYQVTLPAACLRVLRVEEVRGIDYRIEGRTIVSNSNSIDLKYIYDVTDYTTMDIDFYELLSVCLAWTICLQITQNEELSQRLFSEYRALAAKARFDDATEDPAETLGADDWIVARFGNVSQVPTPTW